MVYNLGKLVNKGKVKDIYETDNNNLIFQFSDRISAFDIILPSKIPQKGQILTKFAEYWFEILNVPNHFIKTIDKDKILVKKLEIIPIECVVRGYLYGSLFERVKNNEIEINSELILASKLPSPMFDPTTKFEIKDRPILQEEILKNGWLTIEELNKLKENSIKLYMKMSEIVSNAGFIMADIKFEFGKDQDGNVLLADSIGPDEFRLWNKEDYKEGKTQEAFDKQIIRDWLINEGYKKKIDEDRKNGLKDSIPPILSDNIISKVRERYIYTYEKITGRIFD